MVVGERGAEEEEDEEGRWKAGFWRGVGPSAMPRPDMAVVLSEGFSSFSIEVVTA